MLTSHRLIAGTLGLTLVLAACGGSSTASAGPTAASGNGAAAEASFVAGAAGELEGMIPNEAGGVTFLKTSFDGSSIGGASGFDTSTLDPFLKAHGKTLSDVSMAIASPAASASGATAMVIAIRVKGVDAKDLLSVAGSDISNYTKTNIGGKDVMTGGEAPYSAIVYPKGEVLFEILLASDAVGKAILAKLP